jgi:WD40 repeat protein
VYGGEDGKLYLWRTGEPDSEAIPFPQRAYILSASISPDGTRLAAGAGSNVWIWDLRHLDRSPITLAAHGAAVDSVAFSPDGKRLASGSADKTVRVWEVASTLAETVDDRDQPRSNAVGSALLE